MEEYYQNALQRAHKENRISDEMIEIAENIQTIHNSLASGIVENTLSAETALVEADDFENANETNDKDNTDDLLADIGELFAVLTNGNGLQEDSETLDIQFGNKDTESISESNRELESIIEVSIPEATQRDNRQMSDAERKR